MKIKIEKKLILLIPNVILDFKKHLYIHSLKRSKFYKLYLNKDFNFFSLPVINKSIFMRNFDTINTCDIKLKQAKSIAYESEKSRDFSPMINNISIGLSTGTSGNQSLFLIGENERAKWVAYILDRVINLSYKSQKIAFFLRANNQLYESSNSKLLQFNFFDIYKDFNIHIKRLNKLKPDILIAQPSVLRLICKKINDGVLTISPKKIISIAEVLTEEDKKYFKSVFSVKIEQVYQSAEGFLAFTCKEGFLHFNEDFLIVEKKYINKEKTKFHPIITDLIRKHQPIVRYELDDIITLKDNCRCGNNFQAIKKIEGRSDDIFKFKNKEHKETIIFPDILRRKIVMSDNRINDYQITQKKENHVSLYINSKHKESFFIAKKSILEYLRNLGIQNIKITKSPKLNFKLGDKKRRVINEYKK